MTAFLWWCQLPELIRGRLGGQVLSDKIATMKWSKERGKELFLFDKSSCNSPAAAQGWGIGLAIVFGNRLRDVPYCEDYLSACLPIRCRERHCVHFCARQLVR